MDFEKEKIEEYSVFVALCRKPGSDEVSCFLTAQTRLSGSPAHLASQRPAKSFGGVAAMCSTQAAWQMRCSPVLWDVRNSLRECIFMATWKALSGGPPEAGHMRPAGLGGV